jgi:hypothetical protein
MVHDDAQLELAAVAWFTPAAKLAIAAGAVCAWAPAQKHAARNTRLSVNPENRHSDMNDLLNMMCLPGKLIPTLPDH